MTPRKNLKIRGVSFGFNFDLAQRKNRWNFPNGAIKRGFCPAYQVHFLLAAGFCWFCGFLTIKKRIHLAAALRTAFQYRIDEIIFGCF